jgi:hypothetical protein
MRISFERTGGIAGMRLATTIDSDNLSAEELGKLQSLIEAANFFNQAATSPGPVSGADRFQYKLAVEAEDRSHSVQVNDAAVPAELRPLVQWLTNAARKPPKK